MHTDWFVSFFHVSCDDKRPTVGGLTGFCVVFGGGYDGTVDMRLKHEVGDAPLTLGDRKMANCYMEKMLCGLLSVRLHWWACDRAGPGAVPLQGAVIRSKGAFTLARVLLFFAAAGGQIACNSNATSGRSIPSLCSIFNASNFLVASIAASNAGRKSLAIAPAKICSKQVTLFCEAIQ